MLGRAVTGDPRFDHRDRVHRGSTKPHGRPGIGACVHRARSECESACRFRADRARNPSFTPAALSSHVAPNPLPHPCARPAVWTTGLPFFCVHLFQDLILHREIRHQALSSVRFPPPRPASGAPQQPPFPHTCASTRNRPAFQCCAWYRPLLLSGPPSLLLSF